MSRVATQYIRSLKKQLFCTPSTKNRLVAQFESALSNYLDENPDATLEMLYVAFGTPEQMAATMMQDLTQSENENKHRQNRLHRFVIGTVLTLFFILSMYILFIKQKPIVSHVEITPYESTTESPATLPID